MVSVGFAEHHHIDVLHRSGAIVAEERAVTIRRRRSR